MSNDKMREALEKIADWDGHYGPFPEANSKEWGVMAIMTAREALTAQASAEPVAYLDIGAGGYIDIGSDLSDDVLMKLPKGRHMLTIVGTYGIDGYVPVEPPRAASPVVPEAIEPDDAPEMIPDDEEDMKNAYADGWNACRQALLATSAPSEPKRVGLTDEFYCYDAGLLNDFGGGNVEWWQDYMRAELARAHEFYQSQMPHQSAGDAWSDGYKHAHYEFCAALRSLEQILSRKPLDIPGALMVIKSQRAVIAAHDKANGRGGV